MVDDCENCPESVDGRDWFKSGKPAVFSLGEFISNLVDSGDTDLVIVTLKEEWPKKENSTDRYFRQKFEIEVVPAQMIGERCKEIGVRMWTDRAIKVYEIFLRHMKEASIDLSKTIKLN